MLKLKAPPLTLQAGYFVEQKYQTYNEMAESSTENWEYRCTYELRPKALTGTHQILSLENMLISLGKRPGGMMHDVRSAQNSITLAVLVYIEDKATFDKMKLDTGDIMIFDDSNAYNYMTNKKVELAVVTIRREAFGDMLALFEAACLHKLMDTEGETWYTPQRDLESLYCDRTKQRFQRCRRADTASAAYTYHRAGSTGAHPFKRRGNCL